MNIDIKQMDFELPSLDGRAFRLLESLSEMPVVLAFFKHDCPTCRLTLPFLERLYLKYGEKKASFWGIAQDNEIEAAKFAEEYEITYPILIDRRPFAVSRKYDFSVVPTIILLNRDGSEIQRFFGFQKEELEKMNYILAGLDDGIKPLFTGQDNVPSVKPG